MRFNRRTIPNVLRALRRIGERLVAREQVIASGYVVQERRARCDKCTFHVEGQCVLCTCFVGMKTLVAPESCPARRWDQETTFSTGL